MSTVLSGGLECWASSTLSKPINAKSLRELQSARDVLHYASVFKLADACGALQNPELAVRRMKQFLAVHAGIEN